ncbi:protein DENND6B isoform X2 [Phalacrocorax aristotelis]|uniref:protein DENND6B isoform X2 n=1 Tax=Phalacrocorax aristotelis TaxID=126867 RepID=UPI003F4C2FEB
MLLQRLLPQPRLLTLSVPSSSGSSSHTSSHVRVASFLKQFLVCPDCLSSHFSAVKSGFTSQQLRTPAFLTPSEYWLVYPYDFRLTEKEKTSICYLSFPDSYSGGLGDTQFSFRLRQSGGQRTTHYEDDGEYNREAPLTLQRESAHYFGYVYFRQVKDSSMKRGYFQKSLVLVSRLPYVNLFQSLLQLIAPEYFDKLEPCLEAVCNEIDQWPPPVPGQTLNLPVMGVVIQVRIPSRVDKPGSSPVKQFNQENLLPAPLVLPSIHELDLFRCFQPVLIHIQMLWELVLLGEPIVVMAPSPTVSSEMVLALTSCLAPLRYCCDYRPYFTIHDSEFKEYTTRTQAPPNIVVGVTNPFFIKTLQHWPHILRVGELRMSGDLPKQVKVKKLAKLKTLDTKPGIYTSYKTFLHKDKTLIKRLLKGIQRKRPSEVQSALLRRHLLELTQSFIIPLEHYIASLMPLQRAITPWKNPPQIRPFRQEDFMKTLEHAGPQLTCVLKGDWLGLYRRFFKSPNFDGWYRQRHKEMTQKLEALHLEAICEANIVAWMKDKSEVEIVDLVLKLREKLVKARCQHLPVKEETLQRVGLYIETIIGSLPEDLQTVLHHH